MMVIVLVALTNHLLEILLIFWASDLLKESVCGIDFDVFLCSNNFHNLCRVLELWTL